MQLSLIIYCALLFCLECFASVLNNRPPSEVTQQARIPRFYQPWNQRPSLPLPEQYQGLPQFNRDGFSNIHIRNEPNIPQPIVQRKTLKDAQRIPYNVAESYSNLPNQDIKKNIINNNIQGALYKPIEEVPESPLKFTQQPNIPPQYKQQIVNNAGIYKPIFEGRPVHNVPRAGYIQAVQNKPTQKVFESSTVSQDSKSKQEAIDSVIQPPIVNEFFQPFRPLIPSRPDRSPAASKTPLHNHSVKIIPPIEIKEENVPRAKFEDRYLASASNPIETIVRNTPSLNKYNPPNYLQQFISYPNIRNVLATTKHKKRYLVIHPNGTIEHIDKIETVAQNNPNYILIHAGDININPSSKKEKIRDVSHKTFEPKPVKNNKPQNVWLNNPITNTVKVPTANLLPLLPSANVTVINNQNKLAKPVMVQSSNQSTATLPALTQSSVTVGNTTFLSLTPKTPTIPLRNKTAPVEKISKHSISQTPTNMNISVISRNAQILTNKQNTDVKEPIQKVIKPLVKEGKPKIVRVNEEKERPSNKSIIVYGVNSTVDNDSLNTTAILTKLTKSHPIPKQQNQTFTKKIQTTAQQPAINKVSPVTKVIATANANSRVSVSSGKLSNDVKNNTTVGRNNEGKIPLIHKSKPLKPSVNFKPIKEETSFSHVVSNKKAEVNLIPSVKVETPVAKNFTLPSTPITNEPKKQSNASIVTTESLINNEQKPKPIPTIELNAASNDSPKKNLNLASKPEDNQDAKIPEVKPDEKPALIELIAAPNYDSPKKNLNLASKPEDNQDAKIPEVKPDEKPALIELIAAPNYDSPKKNLNLASKPEDNQDAKIPEVKPDEKPALIELIAAPNYDSPKKNLNLASKPEDNKDSKIPEVKPDEKPAFIELYAAPSNDSPKKNLNLASKPEDNKDAKIPEVKPDEKPAFIELYAAPSNDSPKKNLNLASKPEDNKDAKIPEVKPDEKPALIELIAAPNYDSPKKNLNLASKPEDNKDSKIPEVKPDEKPAFIELYAAPSNDSPKKNLNLASKPEDNKDAKIPEVKPGEKPALWFKTTDPGFWDKLTEGVSNQDVVYFFEVYNQPKVEYNTTRTIHPNGTIVEETIKTLWEIEGAPPIITKTKNVINPKT